MSGELQRTGKTVFRGKAAVGGVKHKRRASHAAKLRGRKLVFEPLEDRRLLAGDLGVRFQFTDVSGNLIPSLQVGTEFLVKVFVQDTRSDRPRTGVLQAYFDVEFDGSLVAIPAADTTALPPRVIDGGRIRTGEYDDFASGTILSTGLIDEVGGVDEDGVSPIPTSRETLLFELHENKPWRAVKPGTLTFTAKAANDQFHWVEFFNDGMIVPATEINAANYQGAIQIVGDGVGIAATDASKAEGNAGNTAFTFTVTRTGNVSGTATVDYAVTGSGASPADAADFGGTLPSGGMSFATGETTKTITVQVRGDTNFEPDEGFTVTLSNATGVVLATPTAAGTIRNDDPALAIAAADAAKSEGNTGSTAFTFTVTRTGLTTGPTTVNYSVAGTGANPADAADFGGTLPSGVVSFAAGETSKTITVNVSGDMTVELDEGFSVTLSNASGGAQITTATAVRNDPD